MCVAFDLCSICGAICVLVGCKSTFSFKTHSKVAATSEIGNEHCGSECAACASSAKVLIGFALSPSQTHFNQFDFDFVSLLVVDAIIIVRFELSVNYFN